MSKLISVDMGVLYHERSDGWIFQRGGGKVDSGVWQLQRRVDTDAFAVDFELPVKKVENKMREKILDAIERLQIIVAIIKILPRHLLFLSQKSW